MERAILRKLEEWVTAPDRKPLVLQGARQVGKTWAAMELGRRRFCSAVSLSVLSACSRFASCTLSVASRPSMRN